jgi:hypothetical protein
MFLFLTDKNRARGPREMEHGNYSTSRTPGAVSGIVSWGDVAVESVAALARWIASLPPDLAPVIGALKVTNDPTCNI